jgi:hypothetical protein
VLVDGRVCCRGCLLIRVVCLILGSLQIVVGSRGQTVEIDAEDAGYRLARDQIAEREMRSDDREEYFWAKR